MHSNRETGRKIANYRLEKNLTQAKLARMAGISESYITKIENGKRKPRIKTLAIIAKALEVELEELLKR